MDRPVRFAVVGLDHRHVYDMVGNMIETGAECAGWWTNGEPGTLAGFVKRFPDLKRVDEKRTLLEDPGIDLILTAEVPERRAAVAIDAMRSGKDVMSDKPGCTTLSQLEAIKAAVQQSGRIWSVCFSERFLVPAVGQAKKLVDEGAIGSVVQTLGLGPHRLNAKTRPDWFFEKRRYGGILADIASHQIDQFLYFTGSTDCEIVTATTANVSHPEFPGLQDFGQVVLRNGSAHGYVRVDWFTPDALPTWGDGRLIVLGTKGYIELRKYVDIVGRPGTNHLFLVNGTRCEHIDCSAEPLVYFSRLADDVRNRTATAMPQEHVFKVSELAIRAQMLADDKH